MEKSLIKSKTVVKGLLVLGMILVGAGGAMAASARQMNQIHKVDVTQSAGTTQIRVRGSVRPMYTAFKLSSPKRLVVDLANSQVKGVPALLEKRTSLIDGVAVSEFTSGKVPVSRIMINFRKEAAYRVKVENNELIIVLTGGPVAAPTKEAPEQVISLANAKRQMNEIRHQADADLSAAKSEISTANAKAEAARNEWRKSVAELNKLKAQQRRFEAEVEAAREEAATARTQMKKNAVAPQVAEVEKEARRKIADLEKRIALARKTAQNEKAEKEKLANELSALRQQLNAARDKAVAANRARDEALAESREMKQQVKSAFLDKNEAHKKAGAAQRAQQQAKREYEKIRDSRHASESEKAALHQELVRRQKETVAAKKRYIAAQKSYEEIDARLTRVMGQLRQARKHSDEAERKRVQTEQQMKSMEARHRQKVGRLETQIAAAMSTAQKATAAKEKAQAGLEKAMEAARREVRLAKKDAAKAVKAAERRVNEAKKTASEAEQRAGTVADQIAKMEARLAKATDTIARQQDKIETMKREQRSRETTAAAVKNEAKRSVAKKDAVKEGSDSKRDTQSTATSTAAPMTQEEKRLARLAQMKKDNRGQASSQSSEPTEPPSQPVSKEVIDRTANNGAIQDIRFVNKGGSQKIVILGNGELTFAKAQKDNTSMVLEFDDARLLPMLERTLDVRDFGGVIKEISSYNARDGKVRVEVDLGRYVSNKVAVNNGAVEWTFVDQGAATTEGVTPLGTASRVVHRENADVYQYPMQRTAAYSVTLDELADREVRYTGRRIDLDFKNADIHNILRLLADVGQVNIVASNDVTGSVTIRMRDVPWDQALDVILQTKGLGKTRKGNLIRVAPANVLQAEYEQAVERIKMSKEMKPLETRLIPISYATAAELKPRADDLLTERGKTSVDVRTNVIVARDVPEVLNQIEALIRNLDTQTPQVLIEGRIVEATSTYAREIGIQWGGDFSASAATGNPTGLAFPSSVGVAGGATDNSAPVAGLTPIASGQPNPNFAVNLPAAVGTGSGGALGISLGSIANNANLNLRLSAMEEEGTLRILSSPKILTLDNREAKIEQGTMIPYSRVSANGVQTAFKEAKLNLTVTPHVTAEGSILLNINMTRDEPDFNNKGARGDPTILKREAQTELLVNDGHTAVIGGIFTRNHGRSYKKVPFFGDIPILGWLFKSRSDSDRRSEMLIFITPTIVNRAESIGQ